MLFRVSHSAKLQKNGNGEKKGNMEREKKKERDWEKNRERKKNKKEKIREKEKEIKLGTEEEKFESLSLWLPYPAYQLRAAHKRD